MKINKTKLTTIIFISLMAIGFIFAFTSISKDITLDKDEKTALSSIGITNPVISSCVKLDEFNCRANVFQKDGINKEIEVNYHYCNNWTQPPENQTENQTEEFVPKCIQWITLTQPEIEAEILNKTEELFSKIANVQINRSQKQEEILTDKIEVNIK